MNRIFIIALLLANTSFSQELKEIFYPNICECFENNFDDTQFDGDLMVRCFDIMSGKNEELFKQYISKKIDTTDISLTYEQGSKMGRKMAEKLFDELQEPLVNNCEAYFKFLLEIKKFALRNMNKGIGAQEADSLRAMVNKGEWSARNMFELGSYELGIGNLKQAKKDYTKSFEKEPAYIPSHFFLGIVYQEEGNYALAIESYNQVISQGENSLTFIVKVFLELAKREAKD